MVKKTGGLKVHIPSTENLARSITRKVIDSFAEIVFLAPAGSYELHNSFKLVNYFDNIDKTSYGALKSFVNYCNNSIRYYRIYKVKVLLRQVIADVNRFLDENYYFLT